MVGFSGGPDSLCLALILKAISRSASIKPLLVHINHRLRPTSDLDERHAAILGREIGLPIETLALSSDMTSLHPGVGVEEAVRRGRYLTLSRVARAHGTDFIATGHHQGDQAETVLLHLLRGAGLDGASAMGALSALGVPWWPQEEFEPSLIRVWRPLLEEPKSIIESYVSTSGHAPIIDESNDSLDFTRNAIRHQVIPVLEAVVSGATSSLARFAEIARAEDALLGELSDAALARAMRPDGSLELSALLQEPEALGRRVLIRWLRTRTESSEIPFERVQTILGLALEMKEGPIVEVAARRVVSIIGERLVAGTAAELLDAAWSRFAGPRIDTTVHLPTALVPHGVSRIGRVRFQMSTWSDPAMEDSVDSVSIPTVSGAAEVRRLRSDDRWAGNGRRVHDALRRERVPVMIREQIVCAASDVGVLWVPGLPLPNLMTRDEEETTTTLSWKYDE